MVATAIYSVSMVSWKETAFPLWRAMARRWKRNVVSRVSSVIVVIRLPIIIIILTPVLNSQGMKKYAMQYRLVQKSSWNEPYSSSSFTKQSCSKVALYR